MSKPTFISLLIVVLLLLMVIFPTKVKGDQPVSPPMMVVAEPVQIIEIPPHLYPNLVPYYIMVAEEFKDAPVMVRIARAESGFDPAQKNKSSSASGLFQIVKGTWRGHHCVGDVFDPEDNIACARKIYEANGTVDWNASKHNWQ
jgi:hypothetical protein